MKQEIEDKIKKEAKIKFTENKDGKLYELYRQFFILGAKHGYELAMEEDKWISVKDKMPEVGEYYLVIVNTDNPLKAKLCYDGWMVFYSDGECATDFSEVTHWQPLPNPPHEI